MRGSSRVDRLDVLIRRTIAEKRHQQGRGPGVLPKRGYMISDRRGVREIPALDIGDKDLAADLAELPMGNIDTGLDLYIPEPQRQPVEYDLKPLKLHFGEFIKHHSIQADSKGWMDQFKKLAPGVVGDADLLVMGGEPVATFRRDARLSLSRLAQEQPQVIAKYTKMAWTEVFDEETFKKEMPDVHAAYRGRSLRLKKGGPGAGLVLPVKTPII